MASSLYNHFLAKGLNGTIDCDTDSFKGMLVTASYTFDADHDFRNDITNEVSGTGYTAGGAAVTIAVTTNTTSDLTSISFSEPSWSTATITNARAMVVYKNRGGASSADELVAFLDFTTNVSSTAATFATDETSPFTIAV